MYISLLITNLLLGLFLLALFALRLKGPVCEPTATFTVAGGAEGTIKQESHTHNSQSHQSGEINQTLHKWRKKI